VKECIRVRKFTKILFHRSSGRRETWVQIFRAQAKCGHHNDVADAGCISGGDEADGATGFSGDEDNYGYKNHVDDSEQEPDFADDALGPEDGEGEADETYLVAFRAMRGGIPGPPGYKYN
jgi:hypothetical protein